MRIFISGALCLLSLSAHAQSTWTHNGSTVTLQASGSNRTFIYSQPRAGLSVSPGTVLFRGNRVGNTYSGQSFLFHPRCGARPFQVSGPVSEDQRTVTLRGRSTRIDANCNVVGYRDETLIFSLVEGTIQVANSRGEFLTLGKDAIVLDRDPQFQVFGVQVRLDPIHAEDPGHDYEMIDRLSGLTPSPFIVRRSVGLNNGFAVIKDGKRWIVYDPRFYSDLTGDRDAHLLMGHEIGHHICGHQDGMMRENPWQRELEADRYAGAAYKRAFGDIYSLDQFADKVRRHYAHMLAGQSHPPAHMRIQAAIQGWQYGSPCEEKGFVRPYVRTEEDKEQIRQAVIDACTQTARDMCAGVGGNTIKQKYWQHRHIVAECKAPSAAFYVENGKRINVFPWIDCENGGRFGEGLFLRIPE